MSTSARFCPILLAAWTVKYGNDSEQEGLMGFCTCSPVCAWNENSTPTCGLLCKLRDIADGISGVAGCIADK
jgi:hypothetical protein